MVPEPTPAPELPAPRALKKYRLVGTLAKGGMAELFLARANGLGGFERLLVIKRILPQLSRDPELVRMLLDEARTAAMLQHANIVQVFDVDMADGNVFFAMEYLHGQPVLSLIERSRAAGTKIPLESAISIAVAVAAGLHYAHERWGADGKPLGIVHRDVAPNNVIVTYDGNVKLIDFGIAKSANNLSRTRFGLFKGKLPYASPEQCRCEPVDRRTDVFSLGVLLYELTTGCPLFVADSEYELLRLMTEAIVPRPRLLDKSFPRELEQIILKALARDPADRYQTAQALQFDLEVFAGKAQLDLSAFALSRLMASQFGGELEQWRTAQNEGLTLEQYITKTSLNWTIARTDTSWALPDDLDVAETVPRTDPVRPPTAVPSRPGLRRHARLALALLGAGAIVGWIVGNALRGSPIVESASDASAFFRPDANPVPATPPSAPAQLTITPLPTPAAVAPAPPPVEPPRAAPARAAVDHPHPVSRKHAPPAKKSPPAPTPEPDDAALDTIVPR